MSTDQQVEFELIQPAPKIDQAEVEILKKILSGRGWVKAYEVANISADLYQRAWIDRKIRALAAASDGYIVSGQRGYKLTGEATIEEVQHAAAWLRTQATAMNARALAIDRVYHAKRR
jgi:hypothetical protein